MKNDYRTQLLQGDFKEKGAFNSKAWRKEANTHIVSSRTLRGIADELHMEILDAMKSGQPISEQTSNIDRMKSLHKSSILLMGYALEMVLKSGVISLFTNLPRKNLENMVRKKIGHKLKEAAKFIELPTTQHERSILGKMNDLVVADARYPITPIDDPSYNKKYNHLNAIISDSDFYLQTISLYEKANSHVKSIKGTTEDSISYGAVRIDDDGVAAYRSGGCISDRLLVSYSSTQKENGETNISDLRKILESCSGHDQTLRKILYKDLQYPCFLEFNKN